MPIIMGMPLHMIIMGMPMSIMLFIISQRSRIMSIMDALAGFIFIIMPSGIISQDIWQFIMGIMPMPMFMPGMPPIMGIMFGIPIMPIMLGIMFGMPIMGIMGIMFGMPIMGIMFGIMFGIPIMLGIMFGMPIIGIMPGIPIIGIMPGIPAMLPLIGIFDIPFIVFIGIPIMFVAIIGVVLSCVLTRFLLPHTGVGAII